MDRRRTLNIAKHNFTALFLERDAHARARRHHEASVRGGGAGAAATLHAPPPARACNLVMGGYGSPDEGEPFDDLSYASYGRNPISHIRFRADKLVDGVQLSYRGAPAHWHGGTGGRLDAYDVEDGEFINGATVYFDDHAVHGLLLKTNTGRTLRIGALRSDVSTAVASPCPADPAHAGRYRLVALAGAADRYLRSVTLIWT
jgi:hypothetical protein